MSRGAGTAPVTVAVVSWNTRELLAACLTSLLPEYDAGRADVWVVDNASSDGSQAMVSERFPWVSLMASEQNLGFGPAVNAVAERSRAEWIAAANADVELSAGALEALLDSGRRDPDAAILAPRLVLADGSTQHSVHSFPSLTTTTLLNLSVERWNPALAERLCVIGHWRKDRRRRVDWAHGAFLLIRRSAFDSVGGFDPDQWMYAEDLDLAWRLRRAGWHTRYEPVAEVKHAVSAATAQAWGDQRTRRSMIAAYEWIARRRGVLAARTIAAINVLGAAARVLGFGVHAARTRSPASQRERARWLWHMRLHRVGLSARRGGDNPGR